MSQLGFDCGCGTRKQTIGSDNFWTGVTICSGVLILALTRGGKVTQSTKQLIAIGAGGAILAIIAERFVKPMQGK